MNEITLPLASEAEHAICGAAIVDPSVLPGLSEIISPRDFADSDLGQLFAGLVTIHEAGLPIGDPVVLVPELRRLGVPEAVRSPAFIAKLLVDGTVQASHAEFYARQVQRAASLRRLQYIGQALAERSAAAAADPADIAAWLDGQLAGLGHHVPDPPERIGDVAAGLVEWLATGCSGAGIVTGLASHDRSVGGWQPGELVILAARPGVGKTSLGMQVAIHNATGGKPVLYVSLEMTAKELTARVLCGLANVDSRRLRAGPLDADSLAAITRASGKITGLPLWLWAPPATTSARIRAVAKRDSAEGGLALVVVDYLGLVRPSDPKRPRHEQMGQVSADLKALAKELSVPVLALAQLNREADGNEPRLSHLRDSGSIEQDADIVLFIHRDEDEKEAAKLICAKHRHGDTGTIQLIWDAPRTRYVDPCAAIVND